MTQNSVWLCNDRVLDLTRPRLMGIVNVTPDSFSDGGKHATRATALSFARALAKEGADILDVGGESTRPGALPVPVDEELARVIPVVETLACEGYTVSVDTSKAAVMKEAIKAGAAIINDVRAMTEPGAIDAVKTSRVGVVLMHFRGTPRTMDHETHYEDVVSEVKGFLKDRCEALLAAGVERERLVIDPGFGFAKELKENRQLLENLAKLQSLAPVLVGLSRKRMIGGWLDGSAVKDRVAGSVAAAMIAVKNGASILRVHDVKETKLALDRYLERESRLLAARQ